MKSAWLDRQHCRRQKNLLRRKKTSPGTLPCYFLNFIVDAKSVKRDCGRAGRRRMAFASCPRYNAECWSAAAGGSSATTGRIIAWGERMCRARNLILLMLGLI